ncbi:MAG: hypothetical protein ACOCUI_04490, partial [bacterium]
MVTDKLTEKLYLSPNIISNWSNELGLKIPKDSNLEDQKLFINLFEKIKVLKENKFDFNEIKIVLHSEIQKYN